MVNDKQIKQSSNNTNNGSGSNGRFNKTDQSPEIISIENKDWTDSLKDVFYTRGGKRITDLLSNYSPTIRSCFTDYISHTTS